MKRAFLSRALALVACLVCYMGTVAQEAYAVFTEGDSTLTFYCDDLRSTRPGTSYSLNTGYGLTGWFDDRGQVGHAVVEPTFAGTRPAPTNS